MVLTISLVSAFTGVSPLRSVRAPTSLCLASDPNAFVRKPEFLELVVGKTGMPKSTVEAILTASLETISESVAQNKKVSFLGFGTFESRARKARVGRNPKTGEVTHCL